VDVLSDGCVLLSATPTTLIRDPTFSSNQKINLLNQLTRERIHIKQYRAVELEHIKAVKPPAIRTEPPGIGVTIETIPNRILIIAMKLIIKFIISTLYLI